MEKKKKKNSLVAAILIVLLALALGYIAWDTLQDSQKSREATLEKEKIELAQAAYQKGATDAILAVLDKSNECNPVPLFAGNFTRTFIDVACLQVQQPDVVQEELAETVDTTEQENAE